MLGISLAIFLFYYFRSVYQRDSENLSEREREENMCLLMSERKCYAISTILQGVFFDRCEQSTARIIEFSYYFSHSETT